MDSDEDVFYLRFGQRLRRLRLHAGLSQETLASQVGLSRPSISNIEAGKQGASAFLLVLLAEALNVDPVLLLDEQDPMDWVAARAAAERALDSLQTFLDSV